MTDAPRIDILLATWNGQRYLAEQIDSILTQTFTDWRLLIRDDGSTDGTLDIIRRYVSENPDRMAVIEDGEKGLGARGN
ncbi:MAG: glycosyltransferase, partial [Alphaproteobacteria bacterium]|nr:glycosyltransferase [Alphaproteobacteria bacterium]